MQRAAARKDGGGQSTQPIAGVDSKSSSGSQRSDSLSPAAGVDDSAAKPIKQEDAEQKVARRRRAQPSLALRVFYCAIAAAIIMLCAVRLVHMANC